LGAASQYTYFEHAEFFSVDKTGQARKDRSETHEVIFVEGLAYKKLVERNEKPLDTKEQAQEQKKMQRAAEERRQQRRSGLLHKDVSLGSDEDLLALFNNAVAGEEKIRGRDAWVVECTPKPDRIPANAHERDVLSFRRTLWIDKSEYVSTKSVHTVVGQNLNLMPGTTITWEFEKISGQAWLTTSGVIEGQLRFAKFIKPRVKTVYTNSGFQKFDVQSTITVEPPK